MGEYTDILSLHARLVARRDDSSRRIERVRESLSEFVELRDPGLTVFVAGSIGRGECGSRSDLDLFITATKAFNDNEKARFVEAIRATAVKLKFAPPTEKFLKVYSLSDLLKHTGSPEDDELNSFTTRMLLLLESSPALNDDTYASIRDQILSQYFRDERGKAVFRPLFLLNDVLRYWRTLCLNYEVLRHDQERPWWKNNANLKFSRMLTVFSTVATLIVEEVADKKDFQPICALKPLQRLARALDGLGDNGLRDGFVQLLDDYESFLKWKEGDDTGRTGYDELRPKAERFSQFMYELLNHRQISPLRRKYLVI